MPSITIDNRSIAFEPGATLLQIARSAGIDIPTLCHLEGKPAQTSCFLCVVRVNGSAKLSPACATVAVDGMVVENDTEEVRDARRTAIELLLSDHLGDCVAPCQGVCPAHMDIPAMLRLIAAGRTREALITVKQAIALPAVLGRICPELCEKGCRRGVVDGSVSICMEKRFVADADLASDDPYVPPINPATGKRVAIVGAGPAGLAAAYYLLQQGHACVLFDAQSKPGGALRYAVPRDLLPEDVLDAEIATIVRMGAQLRMSTRLGADITLADLRAQFDAVLLAIGEVNAQQAEQLGLAAGPQGLKADRQTLAVNAQGVFAAGAALAATRYAVRAVADGRVAAESIDRFLQGNGLEKREREFSVHIGRLDAEEARSFITLASAAGRVQPANGRAQGLTPQEARNEASRCLHCDCGKPEGCKLRVFAVQYGANPNRFKSERKPFVQDTSNPAVIFEPGKCIACGICVQIAAEAKEKLGLTFIGRGFTVKTAAPFGEDMSAALKTVAVACADACPTGALIRREE